DAVSGHGPMVAGAVAASTATANTASPAESAPLYRHRWACRSSTRRGTSHELAAAGETSRCEGAEEDEDAGAPQETEHYPVGSGVADAGRVGPAEHQAANGVDERSEGLMRGEPVHPGGH